MGDVRPPAPDTFVKSESQWYEKALREADEVVEQKGHNGETYCWLFLPSRNTWPTWHINRPAPTPGCGCAPCHRPRCCHTWAEPVTLSLTGEQVAWICPTCLEDPTLTRSYVTRELGAAARVAGFHRRVRRARSSPPPGREERVLRVRGRRVGVPGAVRHRGLMLHLARGVTP